MSLCLFQGNKDMVTKLSKQSRAILDAGSKAFKAEYPDSKRERLARERGMRSIADQKAACEARIQAAFQEFTATTDNIGRLTIDMASFQARLAAATQRGTELVADLSALQAELAKLDEKVAK